MDVRYPEAFSGRWSNARPKFPVRWNTRVPRDFLIAEKDAGQLSFLESRLDGTRLVCAARIMLDSLGCTHEGEM